MNKCVHSENLVACRRRPTNLPLFLYLQPCELQPCERHLDFPTLTLSILIGTVGGLLGGLFGIGGGVVIIPLLTMAQGSNPHLYQAASLVAALLVSAGSIPRHIRAQAIRWEFALRTIPFSIATVGVGIAIGIFLPSTQWLEWIFAAFLICVAISEITRRLQNNSANSNSPVLTERLGWGPASIIGSVMGTLSGLLGIGGGVIAMPLMRVVNHFDIRTTIATSAFLVLPTVIVAVILKFSTLSSVKTPAGDPITLSAALWLAAALAPGAFVGANIGASLVHKLPMRKLSFAFGLLCAILAIRMSGIVTFK